MGPLNLTEDDEKQSAVITKKTLEENVDIVFADDSFIQKEIRTEIKEEYVEPVKTEPLEIQNKIKTEVKQEYVEPTSLSQVKVEPLEIKTEDVKEENVDGDVDYLIKNEIKTEIKEEYVEPTSLSQVKVDPLDEPEEAALTTTCEHCERNFDDVSGLKRKIITGEKKTSKVLTAKKPFQNRLGFTITFR